jgi:hypothetical protein
MAGWQQRWPWRERRVRLERAAGLGRDMEFVKAAAGSSYGEEEKGARL